MSTCKDARNFMIRICSKDNVDSVLSYVRSLKNVNYIVYGTVASDGSVVMFLQCSKPSRLCIDNNNSNIHGAHMMALPHNSPQRNAQYVKELDDVREEGLLRCSGVTIRDVNNMTQQEMYDLPWQMHNIVDKATSKRRMMFKCCDAMQTKSVRVMYIWGHSGCGKTTYAKQLIHDNAATYGEYYNIVKYYNGFWMGACSDCRVALYDEFRDSDVPPHEFINFIDYNVCVMNVKGGLEHNNYNFILITSVCSPYDIYERTNEEKTQWLRRMEIVNL